METLLELHRILRLVMCQICLEIYLVDLINFWSRDKYFELSQKLSLAKSWEPEVEMSRRRLGLVIGTSYGWAPPEVAPQLRLSSTKGCVTAEVKLHQRLHHSWGWDPPEVASQLRLSSTRGCVTAEVELHQRLRRSWGWAPPEVAPQLRLSSTRGCATAEVELV